MSTSTEKLKQFTTDIQEIMNRAAKQGQSLFSEACEEVFADHQELMSFSWAQYAPYFNDGDPCEFSVHGDYVDVRVALDGRLIKIDSMSESHWRDVNRLGYDSLEEIDEDGDEVESEEDDLIAIVQQHTPRLKDLAGSLKTILGFLMANESMAKAAFGEDCRVVVKRTGTALCEVTTEEYSHD